VSRRAVPLDNPAGAIYGTIITAALIAAESQTPVAVSEIVATVMVTLLVYWLAHAYADVLAIGIKEERVPWMRPARRALGEEWPIVHASFAPLVVLLATYGLGASKDQAISIALWFTVFLLAGWGVLAGRRSGLKGIGLVAAAILTGFCGLVIVVMKILLHGVFAPDQQPLPSVSSAPAGTAWTPARKPLRPHTGC
jgi:hypothetical protein